MRHRRTIFTLVIICIITITAIFAAANAEDYAGELVVLRPKIYLNSKKGSGHIKYIQFGTKLKLLSYEYDYCKVEEPDGDVGYVYTGYIGYAIEKIELTDNDGTGGVALSIAPNMSPTDFGYAASGKRMQESAFVLYEDGDYLYIITNEGCSGFVYKYDPNIRYLGVG